MDFVVQMVNIGFTEVQNVIDKIFIKATKVYMKGNADYLLTFKNRQTSTALSNLIDTADAYNNYFKIKK